jgi:hypothetical protein
VPSSPIELVLAGDPLLFGYLEAAPEVSRYTGQPLRQLRVSLGARGDDAHERLNAALQSAGGEDVLISDVEGGHWRVTRHSYSYIDGRPVTTYKHEVELGEHEDLTLERVVLQALEVTPDRWSLQSDGDQYTLTFLVSLGPEDHKVLERMLEKHSTAKGPEIYFPVSWTGIRDTPVRMRFGKCLWESLAGGGARHLVVLVSERGDTAGKLAGLQLFQPELTRMMQHTVITRMKLDALITELHQAGVLPSEAVDRLNREVDVLPFDLMREFDRANDVEEFSTDAATRVVQET